MKQGNLSNIQINARSQKLVRVIEQFVRVLNNQAGEKHTAKVILDGGILQGRELEQRPERSIEDELIDPVMQVLGYEPRFQPTGFDGLDGRYPDFTALNVDVTNIGEVKTPGKSKTHEKSPSST